MPLTIFIIIIIIIIIFICRRRGARLNTRRPNDVSAKGRKTPGQTGERWNPAHALHRNVSPLLVIMH